MIIYSFFKIRLLNILDFLYGIKYNVRVILLHFQLLTYYIMNVFQFDVTFSILSLLFIIIIIACDLCLLTDKLYKIFIYIYLLKYEQTVFEYNKI